MIRLEVSPTAIRPLGFFSADEAEHAIFMLGRWLPTARTQRVQQWIPYRDGLLRILEEALPKDTFVVQWDPDREVFELPIAGKRCTLRFQSTEAVFEAIEGEAPILAADSDLPIVTYAHVNGPQVEVGCVLPPGARLSANGILGSPNGPGWMFAIPTDDDIDLALESNLYIDENTRWSTTTRARRPTHFTSAEWVSDGALGPGTHLTAVVLSPADGPSLLELRLSSGAWSKEIVARRQGARWSLSVHLPENLDPTLPLQLSTPRQAAPIGQWKLSPAPFHGVWKLSTDHAGNAQPPVLSPEFFHTRASDWQAAGPLIELPGAHPAPFIDDQFQPLMLQPDIPLWDSPFLATVGPFIAWIPGYPLLEISDRDGKAPSRIALRELAITADHRRVALRLESGQHRGILLGATRTPPGKEIIGSNGRIPVAESHRTLALWFRGCWLDLRVAPTADGLDLLLEQPLPCDSRLGWDVAAFLPMNAWMANGRVLLRQGATFANAEMSAQTSCWNGLLWRCDRNGCLFLGWRLEPAFLSSPQTPFAAYGFLPGVPSVSSMAEVRLFTRNA